MRQPAANEVISVSELNRQARFLLESGLKTVWLEGEISNLALPGSGHIYFSLKDQSAQVRCAMFRGSNRNLNFKPVNGMAVLVHAKVSIYEARGEYQCVADHMEEAGLGQLRRQFEALKQQLAGEGLFAAEQKQPIPSLPKSIGIVTSPSGAAVRDILNILQRRFPAIPVVIYPTAVQGDAAKIRIAEAINVADGKHDVIILARGGGSLEDLWAFNEDIVARAIFAAQTPIISGVGHETDFTIADLVADLRAPTPSGAAELAVPDRDDWMRNLQQLERRAARSAALFVSQLELSLSQTAHRLTRCSPQAVLQQRSQLLDELGRRLRQSILNKVNLNKIEINRLDNKVKSNSPKAAVQNKQQKRGLLRVRLQTVIQQTFEQRSHRLAVQAGKLHTVSPLATLDRGYAIVSDSGNGKIMANTAGIKSGQHLTTRLSDGEFTSTVTGVQTTPDDKN